MCDLLKYFTYAHLPTHLQEVSKPIGELAAEMNAKIPDGAEKTAGMRKLLEAKDCLVRAYLEQPVAETQGSTQTPVKQ